MTIDLSHVKSIIVFYSHVFGADTMWRHRASPWATIIVFLLGREKKGSDNRVLLCIYHMSPLTVCRNISYG